MKKILLLFILLLLVGCSKKEYYSYNMFYMDTYINVKIYDIDSKDSEKVFDSIDKIYKEYHELSDRFNEYDDLKNVYYLNNTLKNDEEVEIDSKLYELIAYAIDEYNKTNGLVNIALGNVIDLWKKYRDNESGVPTIDELNNSGSININDIVVSNNKYLKKNNVKIDLGSISKGYATEVVGDYLESIGYNKYIINAGGNVKVGKHYNNESYKIGIEDPTDPSKLYKIVSGNNICIITSGSYQRYYEYNGKRYSHIIDPNTLFPPNHIDSITVITKDSAYGDMLSTYLFILPIEEGIEYVNNQEDVEAVWYDTKGNIYYSLGFKDYEQE